MMKIKISACYDIKVGEIATKSKISHCSFNFYYLYIIENNIHRVTEIVHIPIHLVQR